MAAFKADRNDNNLPPPRGIALPFVLTKKIVTDPGIIYTASDAMLFAGTNMVGFVACLAAAGLAATLKGLDIAKPAFLKKHPKLAEVAFDDRTPLRTGALALMTVGGVALASGAFLPAAASLFLAGANFSMAESITKQDHSKSLTETFAKKKEKPSVAALLFKRPDLYLNVGFACAGLMTGGASLFILPLVGIAFGVGLQNAIKGKPEHAGHPKMITAMAAISFAGIGFAGGHGLIAAAHLLNGLVIAEFERRVTPGGSMVNVVKESFMTLARIATFGKIKGKDHHPVTVIEPLRTPIIATDASPQIIVDMGIKEGFGLNAAKHHGAEMIILKNDHGHGVKSEIHHKAPHLPHGKPRSDIRQMVS